MSFRAGKDPRKRPHPYERAGVAQIMVSKREEREGGGEASLRIRTATVRARIRSKEKGGDEGK